jgi:hypothetical protein
VNSDSCSAEPAGAGDVARGEDGLDAVGEGRGRSRKGSERWLGRERRAVGLALRGGEAAVLVMVAAAGMSCRDGGLSARGCRDTASWVWVEDGARTRADGWRGGMRRDRGIT